MCDIFVSLLLRFWLCLIITGESFSTPALGTKCAGYYYVRVPAGGTATIRWQLSCDSEISQSQCLSAEGIDDVIEQRIAEADDFYDKVIFLNLFFDTFCLVYLVTFTLCLSQMVCVT